MENKALQRFCLFFILGMMGWTLKIKRNQIQLILALLFFPLTHNSATAKYACVTAI